MDNYIDKPSVVRAHVLSQLVTASVKITDVLSQPLLHGHMYSETLCFTDSYITATSVKRTQVKSQPLLTVTI